MTFVTYLHVKENEEPGSIVRSIFIKTPTSGSLNVPQEFLVLSLKRDQLTFRKYTINN